MCDPLEARTHQERRDLSPPPHTHQQLASYWFFKMGTISLKNNVEESEPAHQIPAVGAGSVLVFARFTFTDRKAQDVEKRHTQVPRQASRDRFGS